MLFEKVGKGPAIEAGHANNGFQSANCEYEKSKKNPRLQFWDPEAIPESFGNGSDHLAGR
jgi:hypothetical protein